MTSYLGNVIPFGPVPNASKLTGRAGTPPVGEATPDSADDNPEREHRSAPEHPDSPELAEIADAQALSNDTASTDAPDRADARSIIEGLCADCELDVTEAPTPMLRMLLYTNPARRERFNPLESPEKSIQMVLARTYSRFASDDTRRHSTIR